MSRLRCQDDPSRKQERSLIAEHLTLAALDENQTWVIFCLYVVHELLKP